MGSSSCTNQNSHGRAWPSLDPDEEHFLSSAMTESISTPPVSEWSDLTICDGAGSDEGDTFKYRCNECRIVCAGIEDLCCHLLSEAATHVVCPVCFKEFHGKCWEERVKEKQRHLDEHNEQGGQVMSPVFFRQMEWIFRRRKAFGIFDIPIMSSAAAYRLIPSGPAIGEAVRENSTEERKSHIALNDTIQSIPIPANENDMNGKTQSPEETCYECPGESRIRGLYGDKDKSDNDSQPLNPSLSDHSAGSKEGDAASRATSAIKHMQSKGRKKRMFPYYHWEPDMLYLRDRDIDLELLKSERLKEMSWLRDFEGA